jgi:hypothetical protein
MRSTGVRFALACLLVLAQLLVPFAHGLAGAAAPGWTEICASDGLRRVPTGDAPASQGHHEDHCALCRVAGSMPGLAAGFPAWVGAQPADENPALAGACYFGRPVKHDARARAPPPAC